MTGRLVTIGSKGGPALRKGGALPTSSLLQLDSSLAVIDCGLGVTRGLVEAGVDLRHLPPVFITHLHSDHVLELGALLHTAWTTGLRRPVTVFGPPGLAEYWVGFMDSMAFDIALRMADEGRPPLKNLVTLQVIEPGTIVDDGSLCVSALRVDHPPVTDCFALRFEGAGRRVTFSADTAPFEPLAGFARGSDVLVHEAMLPHAVERIIAATGMGDALRAHLHASHTPAAEAARLAGRAAVRRLVLHHLIPADDPNVTEEDWGAAVAGVWDGDITIARDGLELTF